MKLVNYHLKLLIIGFALTLGSGANAQLDRFIEGVHYSILEASASRDVENSSVMEVFSYGCPHCYSFEPLIHAWEGTLPDDVSFVRSPVIWDPSTKHYAQLFFVAESLGITSELHGEIFHEIHKNRSYLLEDDAVKSFFIAQGVNSEDFDRAYKSFGVNSAMRKAESSQKPLKLTGIPSMIVNGKYLINNDALKSYQEVLEVANYLLQKDKT